MLFLMLYVSTFYTEINLSIYNQLNQDMAKIGNPTSTVNSFKIHGHKISWFKDNRHVHGQFVDLRFQKDNNYLLNIFGWDLKFVDCLTHEIHFTVYSQQNTQNKIPKLSP